MYPFPTLPKRLSSFIFAQLCAELPKPPDEYADTRNTRDMAAMAAVAALGPIDMTEAMLAVRVVATDAHARDSLRLATLNHADLPMVLRCRSQAASMMRQSQQAHRALERLQATRPIAPPDHADLPDEMAEEAAADITTDVVKKPATTKPKEDEWEIPPNNLPGFAQLWLLPPHVTRNQKRYEPQQQRY